MVDLTRILELSGLSVLEEKAQDRYAAMFQMLETPNDPALGVWQDSAANEINWARKVLKRSDRIVWYLRFARISLLNNAVERLSHDPSKALLVDSLIDARQRCTNDLARLSHCGNSEITIASNAIRANRSFKERMSHFMSMTDRVPHLNNLQFSTQLPSQLDKELAQIEADYTDTLNDSNKVLPPTEHSYRAAEKIIDFGNGFAWWNLNVQFCDDEGNAMGHCGNNSNMRKVGDRLLSLRKRSMVGGREIEVPYLTFILDRKNRLGEMKGRGNEKPAKRYHEYITALLLNPLVEGIKGGGYLPTHNFSLNDLPEEDREKILEQKPQLERGINVDFNEKLDELREHGLEIDGDILGADIVVWSGKWDSLPHGKIETALSALHEEAEIVAEDISISNMVELMFNLDYAELVQLGAIGGIEVPHLLSRQDRYDLAHLFMGSIEIEQFVHHAVKQILDVTIDELNEYCHIILPYSVELESSEYVYPSLVVPADVFNGEFKITITPQELDNLYQDVDNEDSDVIVFIARNGSGGWFRYDSSYGTDDIIGNAGEASFDEDERLVWDKVTPLMKAMMKKGKKGKTHNAVPTDLDDGEIATEVRHALNHYHRNDRPDSELMGDLFN